MNEVSIPIKVTGLGAIKAELRDLKGQIADATDPAEIARLSQAAGVLKDRISDANDSINNFSTGSQFEQVNNQISGIGDSLANLDFEEAATKLSTFTTTLKGMNPASFASGIGALAKAVGGLSMQFIKMGLSLLVNPIFLLVAVIVAIVAAVLIFLNKIGVLEKAFNILMIPINAVIQLFKDLTDWLGLSSYAADENAAKVTAAMEKAGEASKLRSEDIGKSYDHEIAMAKIAGKDTTNLELEKSMKLQKEAQNRIKYNHKTYQSMKHMDDEEAIKKRTALAASIKADNDLIQAGVNQRLQINAQANKDDTDAAATKAKEAAAANAAAYKAKLEKQKEAAKNRLDAERQIEDLRIAAIKDDAKREQEVLTEKYDRLRADLLTDKTKTDKEKKDLKAAFDLAEQNEQAKITETAKQKENEGYKALNALKIANMVEGEAKIAAQQKMAYNQSLNDAKAKYGAESVLFAEFQEQLQKADEATTKVRSDKKIADQQALFTSITDLTLTEDEKKLAAIEAQYLKEQELANGNAETLLALKNKHDKDIADVATNAALSEIETAAKVRDAKLTFAMDVTKGVTEIGGLLIKNEKKLAQFNKASALVQIGIDTALAISSLVKMSQANALNAVTGGGAGIAQFASGIIQIATNIAKAKNLLTSPSTPVTGGGDTGGGDTGGGSNTATMIPQAAQLFGSSNNANTMTAGGDSSGGGTNMMVTAVVSETQITNVQKKINMINKNSEL